MSRTGHEALFGAAEVDDLLDGAAQVRAFLDVEVALARAHAEVGAIPAEVAERIADAAAAFDMPAHAMAAAADRDGNIVIPLVARLRDAVPEADRSAVHLGATSQDIVDTGHLLLVHRVVDRLLDGLDAAAAAADAHAGRFAETPMAGRTLLRGANPITFGAKAARWSAQLDAVRDALTAVADEQLLVQLGGPVGLSFGGGTDATAASVARQLGLGVPVASWHTDRGPITSIAAVLGRIVGAGASIGLDVMLLTQDEVAELRLTGSDVGASSSMPHKQNPIDAVLLRAAGLRAPGLIATIFTALAQEHERAAGAWHAEWQPLLDLLHLAAGTTRRLGRLLDTIEVDEARMVENLTALGDGTLFGAEPDLDAVAFTRRLRRDRRRSGTVAPLCPYEIHPAPSGVPLFLVASLGMNRQMWEPQLQALGVDRPLVLVEHPGHDGTAVSDQSFDLVDLADAIVGIADEADFDRFDLAGLSLGGMVGMVLAARHPKRLRRLAVLCSSAHLPPAANWRERAATVREEGTGVIAEAVVERWFTDGFRAFRPDTVRWGVELLRSVDPVGYARCCEAIASMDLRPLLGSIRARTLVIAGADDRATPPDHAEVIVAGIAAAELRVVDEAAHLANIEQPETVTALLRDHFRTAGGTQEEP